MNSGIYRLMFSTARGIVVPADEHASARRSGPLSRAHRAHRAHRTCNTRVYASRDPGTSLWFAARAIALAALCAFGTQPIVVEAQATLPMTPDRRSANHPVVGVSASGVPLVNIVAPNQAGVSLNNFTHYNVGTQGAVIVNTPRSAQTQIAGWVQGNPLMGNSPARLIINQVTSGNPTRLLGMTEIAGNRANLVIANPAGITCAGCGFINVPRVSLATARPVFNADGSLAGFDVTRGHLGVAGAGLDARGSAIDLIARAMQINGEVWGQSIQAMAGANHVSYRDGTAASQAGEGETPGVAIDVQALGGMYANSVRLIGTEAGVGVRHSGVVSSLTGSIELSANGDVTIEPAGRIQAADDVSFHAPSVTNQGAIVGRRAVRVKAAATLNNDGVIGAMFNADLMARDLTNRGEILAGVDNIGALAGPGSVTLTGINVLSSGMLAAGDNVNVTGAAVSLDRGVVYAASALNLTGDQSLTTRGARGASYNGTLRSNGALVNDGGMLDTVADLMIDARSVSNRSGGMGGDMLTLTAGNVDNAGGDLVAHSRARIFTADLTNDYGYIGSVSGALHLSVTGDVSNAYGGIGGSSELAFDAKRLIGNRDGVIGTTSGDASIRIEDHANNEQGVIDSAGALKIDSASWDNANGLVVSVGNVKLDAHHLGNAGGTIASLSDLQLDARSLNNRAGRIYGKTATVLAAELRNDGGAIESRGGVLGLSSTGALSNERGHIAGANGLTVSASALTNNRNGEIGTYAGDTTLTFSGDAVNAHGLIASAGKLTLNSQALDNTSGQIRADAARISTADLTNTDGKIIARVGLMDVDSRGSVSNARGRLIGASGLKLDAASIASNEGGQIGALAGNAQVRVDGALTNVHGSLSASDTLTIRAENIDNGSGKALGDSLDVTANRELKNAKGRITATHMTDVVSQTLVNQDGVIGTVNGPLTISTAGITDNSGGTLLAGGDVKLTNTGLINTHGTVSGAGIDLNSGAGRMGNTHGVIEAAGRLRSESGTLDNRWGQMRSVASETPMPAQPDAVTSHGGGTTADGSRDMTLTAVGDADNTDGKIISAGNLALTSHAFDNTSGAVQAGAAHISTAQLNNAGGKVSTRSGQLDIESKGTFSNAQGELIGANGLKLDVASIASNEGGRMSTRAGDARITARARLNSADGTMSAADTLTVRAGEFDNTSGAAFGDAVDVKVDRQLTNTNGRIVATRTTDVEAEQLVNRNGVIGAVDGALTVETTGAIDNAGGKLLAGGNVKLTNDGLHNTDGIVSGANVSLQGGAGHIGNSRGVIDAAARLESDSGALDNRSGLIQSGGLAHLDTHGGTFDNRVAEGSETGGRVIGKGVTLTAGDLQNTAGLISSSDTTRVSAQSVTNDQGAIVSHAGLTLDGIDAISNVAGQIGGDADVTVKGTRIDNTRGAVLAGQSLIVTGAAIVNAETKDAAVAPMAGLAPLPAGMEGATVSLTATTDIKNTTGSIRSDQKTTLSAQTIGNVDGAITSSGRVDVSADTTVTNTRGEINGGQRLDLSTGMLHNDGHMQSRGDVVIRTRDDLTNLGRIVAGHDLDARAQGNVNNSGAMTARNTASVAGLRIHNESGGEMTGDRGTHVHASQSLSNNGLIDGGSTRVEADDTVTNVGRIYGDSISLGAQTVRNEADAQGAGGAIASRGDLDIGAKVIENGGSSLIYASNDIRTGLNLEATGRASDALSDRFTNNGSLIDAGGHVQIAAKRFENLNANFQTKKVTTDSGRQVWYTIPGSAQRFDASDVYLYQPNSREARAGEDYAWSLDDDQKRLLLPSARYPFAEYAKYTTNGAAGAIDGVRIVAIPGLFENNGADGFNAGIAGVFRTVSDDTWAKFGVARPPEPSYVRHGNYVVSGSLLMARRELGPDWYSLNVPLVQSPQADSPFPKLESCLTASADHCKSFNQWYGKLSESYTALGRAVDDYNSDVVSRAVDRWTIYDVNVKSTKDVVTATQPSRITAGRGITINAQSGINDKSQILAGGRAYLNNAIQDNSQPKGIETFEAAGQAISTWVKGRRFGGDQREHASRPYAAPMPQGEIDLPIASVTPSTNQDPVKRIAADASSARGVSGVNVGGADRRTIEVLSFAGHRPGAAYDHPDSAIGSGAALSAIEGHVESQPDAALKAGGAGGIDVGRAHDVVTRARAKLGAIEIRTVEPNVKLPSNALYQVVPNPGSRYLIETDPRFTNHKNWLSSEKMVATLGTDPGSVQKRLGDGFYEQQLIQQQIIEATGQRFIGDYTDNQAQYQALMANGVKAANRFDMNVGTALTDAQMAALTDDIVWLVNREVTLADGTQQSVLVPQVYLRANAADVTGTGSIVAGASVAVNNEEALANSGTIASRGVTIITADSITNVGTMSGDTVRAEAKADLKSLGGLIQGNDVSLLAGRDVNVSSTTSSATTQNGSATAIDGVATINAGTLAVQAGRDLNTDAAQIASTGDALLAAARDVNLNAIRQSSDDHVQWDEKKRAAHSATLDSGSAVGSGGSIGIVAGRDFNATAASVSAQGGVTALAGRDVNLNAGEQGVSAYDEHEVKESGLLSSRSTHTIDASSYTDAIGTTFSGNTVKVLAGENLTARAATIAGTGDVNLEAGKDLRVTTASTESSEYHFKDVKNSGFGSAGAGISYGSNQTTDTSRDKSRGARGSLLGSIDGSVSLRAGEKLHVTGSTIIASQDVTGIAQEVKIDAARTDRRHEEIHEMKSSGFTLAVKSPVIDAIQNVNQQARGAANSQDGRAAALHAIAAGGGIADLAGATGDMTDALGNNKKPEAKIELSFGSSRSKTTFTEQATQSDGSVVRAAGRVAFVATGEEDAGQGNVTIEGSDLTAKDVLLQATNRINVVSSSDTASTRSTNESASASVGVSFGTNGWGVSAAMARAHGDANSDAVTHNSSHIKAGDTAVIISGGDTNLIGANINAAKVMAEIGGDLNIASVQDESRSAARQSSVGGGFSVSQGGGSASVSAKSGWASGNYAGVHEQSGIQAGDGGFDIRVKGNTDLKGAYIASTAEPEKNYLSTGTLSFSDIRNSSSYRATSVGISAGGGVGNGGNNYATHGPTTGKNSGGALPLAVSESGSSEGTTQSAISAGRITITDEEKQKQDIAMLNRDATALNGTVDKLPDLNNVLGNQSDLIDAAQAAAETIAKQIGKYSEKKQKQAREAAEAETDPRLKAQYEQEARSWAEGGGNRVALHVAGGALTGGLTGGGIGAVGGATGAGVSAKLAPKFDELAQSIEEAGPTGNRDVDELLGNLASNVLAGGAGALTGGPTGAMTSAASDRFNRQLHEDEKAAIKSKANGNKAEEDKLTRAACYAVKCWAEYKPGSEEYTANYVSQLEASQLEPELAWVNRQKEAELFAYTPGQKIGDMVKSDPLGIAKDALKVGVGFTAAKTGGLLCGSGLGCTVGAWMFAFGTSDAIEGATSLANRYDGVASPGANPLRWGFNRLAPIWGDTIYDGINLGTSILALRAPVPLNMGKADGLNRPSTMFDVTVPNINNTRLIPLIKEAAPSGSHQGMLFLGIGSKGATVINDIRNAGETQ